MTIKTLKDLERAMQLCAKHGVRTLKIGNIEMQVDAQEAATSTTSTAEISAPTPAYSDEDMLLWSAPNSEA